MDYFFVLIVFILSLVFLFLLDVENFFTVNVGVYNNDIEYYRYLGIL